MAEIVIKIQTDNAAFGENDKEKAEEVARIITTFAGRYRKDPSTPYNRPLLLDANGNTVGLVTVGA